MQAELVEAARTIGLAMGSRLNGHVIGWTTDEWKATECVKAGLSVVAGYNATGTVGWEVRAPADTPLDEIAARKGEATTPKKGMED
jgi:hypothetical protein